MPSWGWNARQSAGARRSDAGVLPRTNPRFKSTACLLVTRAKARLPRLWSRHRDARTRDANRRTDHGIRDELPLPVLPRRLRRSRPAHVAATASRDDQLDTACGYGFVTGPRRLWSGDVLPNSSLAFARDSMRARGESRERRERDAGRPQVSRNLNHGQTRSLRCARLACFGIPRAASLVAFLLAARARGDLNRRQTVASLRSALRLPGLKSALAVRQPRRRSAELTGTRGFEPPTDGLEARRSVRTELRALEGR